MTSVSETGRAVPSDGADANGTGVEFRPARGLRKRWRSYGVRMFGAAMDDNIEQLRTVVYRECAARGPLRVLDLGCWDGETARRYLPPDATVVGLEADHEAAKQARHNRMLASRADLNRPLPLRDGSFDVITSNQVIEHLHDTDTFIAEAYRVLRPGGLLAVSTENLASWHNVAALCLGWQAFSLTNVTGVAAGIGNPLANLRGDPSFDKGWQHQRIFSHRGLLELAEGHGFRDVHILASGYYPLPKAAARLDPRHAALITVVGRK